MKKQTLKQKKCKLNVNNKNVTNMPHKVKNSTGL